ncbi:MAG: glutamate 5-kinase [Pseudomonadota bacterium]|jgi:glutamate 5-kinase
MQKRTDLPETRRLIVKIGSALLTGGGRGLDTTAIARWVSDIAIAQQQGRRVILVSSGSVAEGMSRLGLKTRPTHLNELQAAAAIGQMGLVHTYETLFRQHGLITAQVLLTHEDLSDRQRYLNARSTLLTLCDLGVIPVINENDTVATEEIRFGDNDTLGALVANAVEAELLVILTDQAGLFNRNPSLHPDATLVSESTIHNPELNDMVGDSLSGLGRGGMVTKLRAARLAARSGAATVIASGHEPSALARILAGEAIGTFLTPDASPLLARKRWLAGQLKAKGRLTLDHGAVTALHTEGRSLLPIGVTGVTGDFQRGDLVTCEDTNGLEIARGLINYNSDESRLIQGHASQDIAGLLGYIDEEELIHRDNLVLLH